MKDKYKRDYRAVKPPSIGNIIPGDPIGLVRGVEKRTISNILWFANASFAARDKCDLIF